MRGHRCSYRIKLTQRLGFVNHWFVEELGSHDQLHGKDSDFKVNSQMASALQEPGSGDFSGQLKFKITNISAKSPRKLAPKPNKTPSPERASDRTKEDMNTSETLADSQPAYNYVLGSLSNGHSSLDSLSSVKSVSSQPCYKYDHSNDISTNVSSSQPQNTIDLIKTAVSCLAQTFSQDLPSVSSTSAMNPLLQANLINYMTTMSQFGLAGGSLLQNGAVNPFLVNIKQEPGSNDMEGHNFLPFPHHLGVIPTPIQFMPSQIARASQPRKSHSPSPSRSSDHGQSQGQSREWSPMNRDQMPPGQLQKVMEIEARIKSETSNKVQAHQKTLGQVHTRIMERVKSRKSSHTQCVPQKQDENVMDLSKSSVVVNHCQNRAMENSSLKSGASKALNKGEEQCSISSTAYQRLQTLSHIIQSEAFQNAKNQLEKKPIGQWNGHGEDTALNLSKKTIVPSTRENNDQQQCYFKLAEAWRNGISLGPSDLLNGKICQGADRPGAIDDQKRKVNGHLGKVELDKLAVNPHVPSQREEELMTRVRQLEAQVKQLQNSMVEKTAGVAVAEVGTSKRKKAPRQIDFTKFNTRHVALKVMYLGHDYTGFAGISDDEHTVERAVMEALVKCKLIESKETAFYTRCGRTDKGVSAFGQVLSLDLRSNLLSGVGVKVREGGTAHERTGDKTTEIRYCQILNKNLPPEIRALAWAPVDPDFSARFNCNKRTYKYFFPRGNLNVKLMEQAGQKLVGEHDFRNFCKMSVKDGVINYVRKILEVQIKPFEDSDDGFTMYELTIVGQAFLWHQIRSIFAVLFLVGKGKESIEVVEELLNVTKNPRKPQFNIASDIPLCLYDADFGDQFEWVYEADWQEDNIKCLQQLWAEHAIKAAMVKSMLNDLDRAKVETECDIAPWSDLSPPVLHQAEWLLLDKFNKPLLQRQGGLTLEEQIANNRDRLTERGIDLENKNSADSCDENEDPPAAKRPRLEEGKGSEVEKSREQVVEKGKAEGQGGDVGIVSQDDNGKMVKSKGEDMRFKGDLEDEKVQVELEEDKVVQYIVDKDKVWNADDKYVNNDVK
ncbi:hypothetical protein DPMN_120213 [Dreissena polymorpha]|uniref:Pseudouridine synthase I TruA alpha/beta domain-containing protein n=2 Tax=Dreissena polymorpha TaxID=45954 RepID=A0A9D4GR51_DREPO|nr:hypothetical protein DPMN_120213 [Dreissena polymorpha]